jgi:hypothetical protein
VNRVKTIGVKETLQTDDDSEYSVLRWCYAVSAGNFSGRHAVNCQKAFHLVQHNSGNFKPRRLRIIEGPNYPQTIAEYTVDISV